MPRSSRPTHSPNLNPALLLPLYRQTIDHIKNWPGSDRIFSSKVTLWAMVLHALHCSYSICDIVRLIHSGAADGLTRKRPSKRIESAASAAFCKARKRIPLELFIEVLEQLFRRVDRSVKIPGYKNFKISILDGSTVRIRPLGDVPRSFPPRKTNRSRPGYWALMRCVGLLDAHSGLVQSVEMGSSYCGEKTLTLRLFSRLKLHKALVLADRNFGIYSVVYALVQARALALVRLTFSRACRLAQTCQPHSIDRMVDWSPAADHLPAEHPRTPVKGRLLIQRIHRKGFRPLRICFFTTLLNASVQELLELYGLRWNVETYLRYIKTQMGLSCLNCKSADVAQKMFLAGLIAYNLVRVSMVNSASCANISWDMISFARALKICQENPEIFIRKMTQTILQKIYRFIAALRQPKRRKVRPPEPRALRCIGKPFPSLKGSRAAARKALKKQLLNEKS